MGMNAITQKTRCIVLDNIDVQMCDNGLQNEVRTK